MEPLKTAEEKRFFNDRRTFTYTVHVPERRSGMDRRNAGANKFRVNVA